MNSKILNSPWPVVWWSNRQRGGLTYLAEYESNGHRFSLTVHVNYLSFLSGLSVEKRTVSIKCRRMPPSQATLALNLQTFLHHDSVRKYSFGRGVLRWLQSLWTSMATVFHCNDHGRVFPKPGLSELLFLECICHRWQPVHTQNRNKQ